MVAFTGSIYAGVHFAETVKFSDQMRAIDVACRNLLITLLDAETGQRGYVITANPAYLEPFQAGVSSAASKLSALDSVGANTEQAVRIKDIDRITNLKLKELDKTVAARDESFEAAQAIVNDNIGKNFMDEIRQQLAEIELWTGTQYDRFRDQSIYYGRLGFFSMILALASGFFTAFLSRLR